MALSAGAPRLVLLYLEPFFGLPALRFNTQLPLTHLVKAEIVSPHCGILINTYLGNPTVPFA